MSLPGEQTIYAAARDITERKQAKETIARVLARPEGGAPGRGGQCVALRETGQRTGGAEPVERRAGCAADVRRAAGASR